MRQTRREGEGIKRECVVVGSWWKEGRGGGEESDGLEVCTCPW
jgi:hypothetical protein